MAFLDDVLAKTIELQSSVEYLNTKSFELHEILHSGNILLDQEFIDSNPILKAKMEAKGICLQIVDDIKNLLAKNKVSFGKLQEKPRKDLLNALNAKDIDARILDFFANDLYPMLEQSTSEYNLLYEKGSFSIKKKLKEEIKKPKRLKKLVSEKILQQRYQELITKANIYFYKGNLSKAKKLYNTADKLYPKFNYAREQVKKIEAKEKGI